MERAPPKTLQNSPQNEDHHLIWAVTLHDLLEMGTNDSGSTSCLHLQDKRMCQKWK